MSCTRCGHGRPQHRDQSGPCLLLQCGCARYVGGAAPISQEELRQRIRARLQNGALPRDLPDFPETRPAATATMLIRPGRGQACSACDGPDADVTYRYPDRDISFHLRCDEIWGEERQLP